MLLRTKERRLLTRAGCIAILALASVVALGGCGDILSFLSEGNGTSPADTTPPEQSVTISDDTITAASGSIAFEIVNPNAEEVRVTIALTTPQDSGRIIFDSGLNKVTETTISLTSNGTDGARKLVEINGLTNGIAYTITLTTADSSGNAREQTATGSAIPLAAPNAPFLIAAAGDSSVALSWIAPTGAVEVSAYRIYRAVGNGEFMPLDTELLSVRTLTYTDATVTNSTAYRYRVLSVNANGAESADSNTVLAIPLAPPNAPILAVVAEDRRVTLTWSTPAGSAEVSDYRIYRRDDRMPNPKFTLLTTGSESLPARIRTYTDAPVENGAAYSYRIRAVNINGTESADSNTALKSAHFYLHTNGVTIICTDAANNATGVIHGKTYTKRTASQIRDRLMATSSVIETRADIDLDAARSCTSGITDMTVPDPSDSESRIGLFHNNRTFNADISRWDTSSVENMSGMFRDARAFNQNIGSWNVEAVTDMSGMFRDARAFNQNIGSWNVEAVTDMSSMFYGAYDFNQNIGRWKVGAVENMSSMFESTHDFNQNISSWNVGAVTDMSEMFRQTHKFNQNIGRWNVAAVTDMNNMFRNADAFNQNIGRWKVEAVENMSFMFWNAPAFNQNIGRWKVGAVENMSGMFGSAIKFNQDIGSWNVGAVTDMRSMFWGATDFNQNIGNWTVEKVTNMSGMFWFATNFNQDIGNWKVGAVTDMSFMFSSATMFDQDLSGWCVVSLMSRPNAPSGFVYESPLANDANSAKLPKWSLTATSCSS